MVGQQWTLYDSPSITDQLSCMENSHQNFSAEILNISVIWREVNGKPFIGPTAVTGQGSPASKT